MLIASLEISGRRNVVRIPASPKKRRGGSGPRRDRLAYEVMKAIRTLGGEATALQVCEYLTEKIEVIPIVYATLYGLKLRSLLKSRKLPSPYDPKRELLFYSYSELGHEAMTSEARFYDLYAKLTPKAEEHYRKAREKYEAQQRKKKKK